MIPIYNEWHAISIVLIVTVVFSLLPFWAKIALPSVEKSCDNNDASSLCSGAVRALQLSWPAIHCTSLIFAFAYRWYAWYLKNERPTKGEDEAKGVWGEYQTKVSREACKERPKQTP